MKKKFVHFLMRTLALALALILTLGTLPLMSFAQELGVSEATKPANPQGDGTNYTYSFPIEFFFATGKVEGNKYSAKGFWPSWHNTIKGTVYSNTLAFTAANITKPHYVVGTEDIKIFDGAKLKLNYDSDKTTDYFGIEDINKPEIFNALLSEVTRLHVIEPFIMRDHNNNPVILKPEDLKRDDFKIWVFRYANPLNVQKKLHVDIYIERPDGQKPIHVEKMNLPGGIKKFTSEGKYGMSPIEEDGYVVSKIEVTVDGNTHTYETPEDIKNNPVIHDDKEKTVKVWYSKKIKFHIVKDDVLPEKPVEQLAELSKDYDITDILTAAHLPDEYEYKGLRLKEVGAELLNVKLIPSDNIDKDLTDVYLYFETIDNKSHIQVTIEKEGETPTTENIELTIGSTYHIPTIPDGYVLESFTLDGTPQPAGTLRFEATKPNHNVVIKFAKKTSGGIRIVPATLDDAPFTPEDLNKYALKQISLPSQPGVPVEIEIAEPKGLKIKSVMNGTVEAQANGEGKYVATNNSPDPLVLLVNYKKHMSSINVTHRKDGAETGPEQIEGQVGTEFKPNPVEGYEIEIYVKTPAGEFEKVDVLEFKDEVQDVKLVYVKKPDNNNNNNNSNNNDNDNNNSNNSGDNEGNRERDEYREYNPDRDKNQGEVITDDGKTPLGPLEKFPFYAYLQGYPDGSVRPNAYVSRQETAAVFFRLLDATYRESIRSEENPFSDVDKSNWSNKHISTLAKGGIVRGYTDGTFRPKQIITRAELIEIASNFDAADGKVKHNFKSMNGELAPNTLVTRADFARIVNKVLGRNVKKSEIPAGVKQFTDLTPEMDFYEDMITATNSYNATKGDDAYQKWIELIPSNIEM